LLGIDVHGTEFGERKLTPPASDAGLPEEYRPSIGKFDQPGDDDEEGANPIRSVAAATTLIARFRIFAPQTTSIQAYFFCQKRSLALPHGHHAAHLRLADTAHPLGRCSGC
jgi:hypothetical protein